jgi:hypothetical protein
MPRPSSTDFSTTLVYADFAPDPSAGAHFATRAFDAGDTGADTEPSPLRAGNRGRH